MAQARPRLSLPRGAVLLIYAAAAPLLFRDGIDAYSILSLGMLVLIGAGLHFAARLRRPLGSYLLLGLASAFIGFALMGPPLMMGDSPIFGVIAWVGVTALGLIWLVHYERTEPR